MFSVAVPEEPSALISAMPFVTTRQPTDDDVPLTGRSVAPGLTLSDADGKPAPLSFKDPSATSISPSKELSFVCCCNAPAPVLRMTPPAFEASVAVAVAPEPVADAIDTVTLSPAA